MQRSTQRQERSSDRDAVATRREQSQSGRYDRNRSGNDGRGDRDRYRDNRSGGNRSGRDGSYDRGRRDDSRRGRPSYGRDRGYRQPHYSHGRVSRVARYGGGYRVWIHGTPYPFYVPLAYYHRDRFRIGLSIRLGGWYNPLGYYDYYDGRSAGAMRGVVESVDYGRDSFVVRNEATGSFVTVVSRDRRMDVRPGDYVELSGDWTRSGVFQAWDVDLLDYEYRR